MCWIKTKHFVTLVSWLVIGWISCIGSHGPIEGQMTSIATVVLLAKSKNNCSLVQPEAPLDLRKSMTPQMLRRQGMRTPSRQPSLMEVMGVCLGASSSPPAGGNIVTSTTAAALLPTSRHLHALCPGCLLHVMSGRTRPRYCSWAALWPTDWINHAADTQHWQWEHWPSAWWHVYGCVCTHVPRWPCLTWHDYVSFSLLFKTHGAVGKHSRYLHLFHFTFIEDIY